MLTFLFDHPTWGPYELVAEPSLDRVTAHGMDDRRWAGRQGIDDLGRAIERRPALRARAAPRGVAVVHVPREPEAVACSRLAERSREEPRGAEGSRGEPR